VKKDIEELVGYLKEKVGKDCYLCLGFDPEDAGRAIVVGKDGVFLGGAEGIEPIQNLEKYKDAILETIEISERQKRPLCEKYLKDICEKYLKDLK